MSQVPPPTDPLIQAVMARDPELAGLWEDFCAMQAKAGLDPNAPPRLTTSFRAFANKKLEPEINRRGILQYGYWKTVGQSEMDIRAQERAGVRDRVTARWGPAIDLLDQLLSVAEEFAMTHADRLMAAGDAFPRTYPLLINLHARGVQVAEEILVLLKAGFAAGAEARWRTLHETAIVAAFIARHGEATVERYAEHDNVRVLRAMEVEQEHHEALGLEPYTERQMTEARERVEELKRKYGAVFVKDFGWAAEALKRLPNGRAPTFADLQASLGGEIARAAYRSASEAVHAGPGALVDNAGTPEGATSLRLTRGTEFGLLEPGARTAGTIVTLSHALMEWRPFPMDRVSMVAMRLMAHEVVERFRACETENAASGSAD